MEMRQRVQGEAGMRGAHWQVTLSKHSRVPTMWIPEVSGSQVEEMVRANAQAAVHL